MNDVYIVSAVRTPMGSFNGMFSSIPAPKLGATAIKGALSKAGVDAGEVDEVFMGNVLQAGVGQAPARQASMYAGISEEVPCTTSKQGLRQWDESRDVRGTIDHARTQFVCDGRRDGKHESSTTLFDEF